MLDGWLVTLNASKNAHVDKILEELRSCGKVDRTVASHTWEDLGSIIIIIKWANPGLFLFIFVLFNNHFTEKIVDVSRNRNRIVGVEGEHADH